MFFCLFHFTFISFHCFSFGMPTPKKKSLQANKKLVVMYPSRGKSARIQSKIKDEPQENQEEYLGKKVKGLFSILQQFIL